MVKVIRVIETRIHQYEPDLDAGVYTEEKADTVEKALALDQHDYKEGKVNLEELGTTLPVVSTVWEIIDDGT